MTVVLAPAVAASAKPPVAAITPLSTTGWAVPGALRRPSLLTAATVLLVCLPVGERSLSGAMQMTPADLAAAALVVVAAARIVRGEAIGAHRVWLLLAAALVACALATVAAPDTAASLPGFIRYAQVFVLVPAAVAVTLRDRLDIGLVCGAVLAAGMIEGAVGAWQTFSGTGASYGDRGIRAVGTFGAVEIMAMANVVAYAIVVAVGLALTLRGRPRGALVTLATALVVPLLASLSRGAWLATAFAVAAMVLLVSLRLAACLAVVALTVAVLATAAPIGESAELRARIASVASATASPDRSVSDRYQLWDAAVAMWGDHPVTGVGPRQFPAFRDAYAPIGLSSGSDTEDPQHRFQRTPLLSPHNMYLLVLSEQGLLGGLAFGGLLTGLAAAAVRRARRAVTARSGTAGTAPVALAAVGLLAWHLANFAYADTGGPPTVLTAVTLGIGLWWVGASESTRTREAR